MVFFFSSRRRHTRFDCDWSSDVCSPDLIDGSAARITAVQENPRHYFQQPDAGHVRVDSTATSLTGWAARVYVNKQKGNWFSNSAIGVIAPGFDVHDLGFLWRTRSEEHTSELQSQSN